MITESVDQGHRPLCLVLSIYSGIPISTLALIDQHAASSRPLNTACNAIYLQAFGVLYICSTIPAARDRKAPCASLQGNLVEHKRIAALYHLLSWEAKKRCRQRLLPPSPPRPPSAAVSAGVP
jgi:hypothetical protein